MVFIALLCANPLPELAPRGSLAVHKDTHAEDL